MKRCTKCNQVYADELLFCLADGTPLGGPVEEVEEQPTLVRHAALPAREQYTTANYPAATTAAPEKSNAAMKIAAVAAGLLLLLVIIAGATAAYILWPRDTATVKNTADKNSNAKSPASASPEQTVVTNSSNSAVKDREDELERERKKLADERKKLEDEKKRREAKTGDEGDDPPANPPPPTAVKDPGPSRIAFRRGSTGATVSGTVGRARSYMLRAMDGQYLGASVRSPGGCVVFSSGGASTQFSTGAGDTYLYLRNTCSTPSTFSMSVTVR